MCLPRSCSVLRDRLTRYSSFCIAGDPFVIRLFKPTEGLVPRRRTSKSPMSLILWSCRSRAARTLEACWHTELPVCLML